MHKIPWEGGGVGGMLPQEIFLPLGSVFCKMQFLAFSGKLIDDVKVTRRLFLFLFEIYTITNPLHFSLPI